MNDNLNESTTQVEKYQPPAAQPSAGDGAHTVLRASLSAIPGVGGPLVELFNSVVAQPLEKRRQEWMEDVGAALRSLEANQGVQIEDLKNNDVFVDTVLQATQIFLRNSQQEKREALRNAVLNSALPNPPEASKQQMFLGYIDALTVWHLRILKLFHHPALNPSIKEYAHRQELGGGLATILEKAFPELVGQSIFYKQICKELNDRGLLDTPSLGTMMTGGGLLSSRTTKFGKEYLCFIEAPPQIT